jgi:hypothetical protein
MTVAIIMRWVENHAGCVVRLAKAKNAVQKPKEKLALLGG